MAMGSTNEDHLEREFRTLARQEAHAQPASHISQEIRDDIAALIRGMMMKGTTEIDTLSADLQEVRRSMQAEGERLERETAAYTQFLEQSSTASRSLSDALAQIQSEYGLTRPAVAPLRFARG